MGIHISSQEMYDLFQLSKEAHVNAIKSLDQNERKLLIQIIEASNDHAIQSLNASTAHLNMLKHKLVLQPTHKPSCFIVSFFKGLLNALNLTVSSKALLEKINSHSNIISLKEDASALNPILENLVSPEVIPQATASEQAAKQTLDATQKTQEQKEKKEKKNRILAASENLPSDPIEVEPLLIIAKPDAHDFQEAADERSNISKEMDQLKVELDIAKPDAHDLQVAADERSNISKEMDQLKVELDLLKTAKDVIDKQIDELTNNQEYKDLKLKHYDDLNIIYKQYPSPPSWSDGPDEHAEKRTMEVNNLQIIFNNELERLFPAIAQAKRNQNEKNEQIKALEASLKDLNKRFDQAFAPIAKKLALNIATTEFIPATDTCTNIRTIKTAFANMSEEKLNAFIHGYEDSITSLKNAIKEYADIRAMGKDAINLTLLNSSNSLLFNKKVILAIFALDALAHKGKTRAREMILIMQNFQNPQFDYMISSMIEWGFKGADLMQLEAMPINFQKTKSLAEYIRRKDLEKTFLPILKSIHDAAQDLSLDEKIDFEIVKTPNTAYKIDNWVQYSKKFDEILEFVDDIQIEQEKNYLLRNAAGFSPRRLQEESTAGFKLLLEAVGIALVNKYQENRIQTNASVDEVVTKICSSTAFLDQNISHSFDRIHLMAEFFQKHKYIQTVDGAWSGREILAKIVQKIAETPLDEYSITAEQLYIRLKLIEKKIKMDLKEQYYPDAK